MLKKYFRVYRTLLRLNFDVLVAYRGNFINSLLASLAWGAFSLYSIVLLTSKTNMVFGWRREELLLLNGVYGIFISFFHMQFSRNFERFSELIHLGHLDSLLVKPLDSQFLVSFWLFGYATISRTIISLIYTFYIAKSLSISFSLPQLLGIVALFPAGLLLLYSIWFIIITITIWFSRLSNLVELMFTVTGTARYPQEMLRQVTNYVFVFLFPFTLVVTLPTKAFLNRLHTEELFISAVITLLLFVFSRKFWKFALRSYTSASS